MPPSSPVPPRAQSPLGDLVRAAPHRRQWSSPQGAAGRGLTDTTTDLLDRQDRHAERPVSVLSVWRLSVICPTVSIVCVRVCHVCPFCLGAPP